MVADTLAPNVARSSAAMILTVRKRQFMVTRKDSTKKDFICLCHVSVEEKINYKYICMCLSHTRDTSSLTTVLKDILAHANARPSSDTMLTAMQKWFFEVYYYCICMCVCLYTCVYIHQLIYLWHFRYDINAILPPGNQLKGTLGWHTMCVLITNWKFLRNELSALRVCLNSPIFCYCDDITQWLTVAPLLAFTSKP